MLARLSLTAVVTVICLACGAGAARAESIAFTGATLIDGNGGPVVANGTVVIDGDRIAAVGGADTRIPKGAKKIAVEGKYIIPGLMDANVHLLIDVRLENLVRYEGRYPELIVEAAQVTLKNGLTTVFDSWGPLAPLVEARRRIDAAEVPGSRIYFAGNIVGFGGPISKDFFLAAAGVASKNLVDRINGIWEENVGRRLMWLPAEQVGAEIRAYTAKGVDFVKYGASGHTFGEMQFIMFSDAAQRAIVEESHRAGITVQTHSTSVESFRMAIDAGVDMMQHCEITGPTRLSAQDIQRLADKRVYCAVLAQTEHRLAWFRELGSDPLLGEHFGTDYQVADQNIRAMIKAQAPIVLSTDAGLQHPDAASDPLFKRVFGDGKDILTRLGEGHFTWLTAAEQKGMEPMAMLMAATRDIARAYKRDADLGTVAPGKIADLVILDRNPLESAQNYRSIHQVVKSGRIVDRQALPTHPLLTAPTPH